MRKTGIAILACLLIFTFSASCLLAEEEANYQTKLKTGLINILTGWIEIPRQIKKVTSENDPVAGLTYGTARGIAFTLARMIVGAFDVITCPFHPYDKPMIKPDYSF